MAAFEAVLSFGLAVAYVAAGPVLTVIAPQSVYLLGGAGAALAALILVPLLRLRHEPDAGSAPDLDAEAEIADAMMYPPAS